MSIFDMPNFLWVTIVAALLLTVFCNLVLNKWFTPAVITFVVLGIAAFLIPNFKKTDYQPLLGYAAFLAIVCLIVSFLIWYFTRDWRKKRKAKRLNKEIRKRGGIPKDEVEDYTRHNK